MPKYRTDRNQVFDQAGRLISEEVVQIDLADEATETDRLRARVAELEATLVEKGVIDKADAEAVATVEVTATEITKPGDTKDALAAAEAAEVVPGVKGKP